VSDEKRSVPIIEIVRNPEPPESHIYGGSTSEAWNQRVIEQVLQASWLKGRGNDEKTVIEAALATTEAMISVAPVNALEGMAAAQLIAAHEATMECYRRAMLSGQSFEGRQEVLNQANKLSRTWVTLLVALDKHRGKGQQKVTVEHVHVYEGGQAIVGNVDVGGGGNSKSDDQAHAKQVTDAHESPMRRPDTQADVVPITGNAKR
jgi:hypothetical protein